tara:strand:- start:422 stop:1291 length:870 start_codon:yes stop_codon:yes gene_type:complete
MKIVVLGGSGFIGSHVADELSKAGHNVTVFDKKKSKWLRSDQKMILGDIFNYYTLEKAIKGNQIVYNFAALSDLEKSLDAPLKTAKVNILGTVQALNISYKHKVKRFVHASSIYSLSDQGGFYSCSKRASEDYIVEFNRRYKLSYTILRFGSVYGERADKSNGIRKILDKAIFKKKIVYTGNKKTVRRYINVLDAAKASVRILENKYRDKFIILTGNNSTKIRQLLDFISKYLNIKTKIIFKNIKNYGGHYIKRPTPYKPKKGRRLLFKSQKDFNEGLINLIKQMRKKK